MVFQTMSGTLYSVDTINHIICGGVISEPTMYERLQAIIGERGYIALVDGRVITTSVVVGYM